MAAGADEILDRRRLRRKLGFWRIMALLLAAAAALGAYFAAGGDFGGGMGKDHIAKVRIAGPITEDEELIDDLREEADRVALELAAGGITEIKLLQEHMHDAIGQLVYDRTRRRPMILPVVIEV